MPACRGGGAIVIVIVIDDASFGGRLKNEDGGKFMEAAENQKARAR